jgi:hypothetical protein
MKTDRSHAKVTEKWRLGSNGSHKKSEPQPPLTSICLQPIFGEDGQVLEYALIANPLDPFSTTIAGRDLWTTIAFLQRHNEDLRLSIQWPDSQGSGQDLATRLRTQLEFDSARYQEWISPVSRLKSNAETALRRSTLITFGIPMDDTLAPFAPLLQCFPDFKISLRANIEPIHKHGLASGLGELRASGLRIVLPANIAQNPSAQGQFRIVFEIARMNNLQVCVCEINDIADIGWLREYQEVLLQGDALSRPLSCDFLKEWWARGSDWRSFSMNL